jgi:hypothetical protein
VQSAADEVIPTEEYHRSRQALLAAGIAHQWQVIARADHAFMHYAWEREVIARTVEWLCRTLTP